MRDRQSPQSGGNLVTAANALSLLRILSLPLIVVLVLQSEDGTSKAATLVFVVAALTDLLDGRLARRTSTVTELGKVLDPLADRILIGGTVLALAIAGALPVFGVALVVLRDIFMIFGYKALKSRGVFLRVSMFGKSYTALLMVAIVAVMAGIRVADVEIGLVLFWIGVAGSLLSGIFYTARGSQLLQRRNSA